MPESPHKYWTFWHLIQKNPALLCGTLSTLCMMLGSKEFLQTLLTPTSFKYKYGDSKNKNRILLWCFIIFVTAIIIAPYLLALPAFEKTLVSIQALKAGESVDLSRAMLYKRAIEMWLEKPILGHGWFEYYYSNTGIILAGSRSFAHNLFEPNHACCVIAFL